MLIRNAELSGGRVDVRLDGDRIVQIEDRLAPKVGEADFDAKGGALLPGLHDHHIHLLSLAASLESIACGPPDTSDARELKAKIERASRALRTSSSWLRGTGYFESVAGPLDRHLLDQFCPDRPIRIQHRSGSMWFLNSRAIEALGLDAAPGQGPSMPPGLDRDAAGRPTGRLFRLDAWLRSRIPPRTSLDLGRVGRRLASCGVIGVTDATPANGPDEVEVFREAQATGALPQRLHLMGTAALSDSLLADSNLSIGALKVLLDEPALPEFDALVDSIRGSHALGRPVAIHTVTRSEIYFALAAFETAAVMTGDRLEHASVAPSEAIAMVRKLGVTIVSQPNFVAERGDDYLATVDPIDRGYLYRLRAWLDADIGLGGGTDAPFGDPDPWKAMRAAVERRTRSGTRLGLEEALTPERALGLFLTEADDPGGPVRTVATGARADLCLLDVPWRVARDDLSSRHVAATLCAGRIIWKRSDGEISG